MFPFDVYLQSTDIYVCVCVYIYIYIFYRHTHIRTYKPKLRDRFYFTLTLPNFVKILRRIVSKMIIQPATDRQALRFMRYFNDVYASTQIKPTSCES
jgi:hypothetical protein